MFCLKNYCIIYFIYCSPIFPILFFNCNNWSYFCMLYIHIWKIYNFFSMWIFFIICFPEKPKEPPYETQGIRKPKKPVKPKGGAKDLENPSLCLSRRNRKKSLHLKKPPLHTMLCYDPCSVTTPYLLYKTIQIILL